LAVHIRLMRMGKKKRPYYRIVAIDGRNQRDGKYLENLGYYHPVEDGNIKVDLERYNYWIENGAIPTPTVKSIVKKAKKA